MAEYCKITVHYLDGHTDEYLGGLHATETLLRIWPRDGPAIAIPLINIRKYETSKTGGKNEKLYRY